MADFQERLCDFLSECKNDALQELNGNAAYIEWRKKLAALNSSIATLMPPDCLEAFKQYQETVSAISGLESDYCYVCGIRDYLRIGRQFDIPHGAEWDSFASHMIPNAPGNGE